MNRVQDAGSGTGAPTLKCVLMICADQRLPSAVVCWNCVVFGAGPPGSDMKRQKEPLPESAQPTPDG
jgi:hypothetical protein